MAKQVAAQAERPGSDLASATVDRAEEARQPAWPEYDLVNDVVFDPPLTPEEHRRVGLDITPEERLEQVRRQLAEGNDGF